MVDVVDVAVAVADIDQGLHDLDDVFLAQHARSGDLVAADAAVEFHAADRRQVIALAVEEQILEQVLGRVLGRRLAGTHHAIDFYQRLEARLGRIDPQRVGDIRAAVQIVDIQRAEFLHADLNQLGNRGYRQDFVGLGQDLAGLGIDDVMRKDLALQILEWDRQALDAGLFEIAHMPRRDAAAFLDDDFLADSDLERRGLAAQALRDDLELDVLL